VGSKEKSPGSNKPGLVKEVAGLVGPCLRRLLARFSARVGTGPRMNRLRIPAGGAARKSSGHFTGYSTAVCPGLRLQANPDFRKTPGHAGLASRSNLLLLLPWQPGHSTQKTQWFPPRSLGETKRSSWEQAEASKLILEIEQLGKPGERNCPGKDRSWSYNSQGCPISSKLGGVSELRQVQTLSSQARAAKSGLTLSWPQ
jgi:hypothetical protein